ncbi:Protein-methionine-sulfoxide reductase heme-binding subunit MsrQ [hydrothermal vent metagenome]|uniref:Protein-methionine-sulfoxide reductase heme-binding subunit MsrQ n=1 Tax=hydrothermal vent metagenome TaxID=652676 RepID=A0A3B1ABT6_9ZZZZ
MLADIRRIKVTVFFLCLLPLVNYGVGIVNDSLGANPIEFITRGLGEWGLRFLLVTLALSPLRLITKDTKYLRFRRMLGLFSFFYISLHLTTYIWLDQFFDWNEVWIDVVENPFITAGMLAYFLLIPLALTSTNKMMRRLRHNWKRLHKLIYFITGLGILHFFWLVKADLREPIIYLVIYLFLLLFRFKIFSKILPINSAKAKG